MNTERLRAALQKGLVFAIVMIFMVLVDFEVMAATLISKIAGTNVVRGGIHEVRFMAIFLALFGVWIGGRLPARQKKRSPKCCRG